MTDPNMPKGVFTLGLRELAFVPRWTVARTTRKPSVAEHSYYVAQYADGIAELIEWKGDRHRLLQHALWHDVEEMITGDIPGPVKRGIQNEHETLLAGAHEPSADMAYERYVSKMMNAHYGRKNKDLLNTARWEGLSIVKVADILEDLMFAIEQYRFGNRWMDNIRINDRIRLEPAIARLPGMDDDLKLRTVRSVLFNFVDVVAFRDPILPE